MDDAADTAIPVSDKAGNPFAQIPIEITVSVGKSRPLVRDLLNLKRDSVYRWTSGSRILWSFLSATS